MSSKVISIYSRFCVRKQTPQKISVFKYAKQQKSPNGDIGERSSDSNTETNVYNISSASILTTSLSPAFEALIADIS